MMELLAIMLGLIVTAIGALLVGLWGSFVGGVS